MSKTLSKTETLIKELKKATGCKWRNKTPWDSMFTEISCLDKKKYGDIIIEVTPDENMIYCYRRFEKTPDNPKGRWIEQLSTSDIDDAISYILFA